MTHNFKTLGLALAAVLAISATTASAAMALTPKVKVGNGDGNVTSAQLGSEIFMLGGGRTVHCEVVKGSASLATESTTISGLVGILEKCSSTLAGVEVPVTITTNGCSYTIHIGETTGTADQYTGTVDIVCPEGKSMESHVYKEGIKPSEHTTNNQLCGYKMGAQTGLGSATATNITTSSPKDIELSINISKVTYTKTLGTIPNCGPAANQATLVGKSTVRGLTTSGVATDVQIVEV